MPARRQAQWEFEETHSADSIGRGASSGEAKRSARQLTQFNLYPRVVLEFTDLGPVTVKQVLANPERYKGEYLADPIEGVTYGRSTAVLNIHEDGTPWIFSQAHGAGWKYTLCNDKEVVSGGVPRILTDLTEINSYFAYLNVPGESNAFVSRKDGMFVKKSDLSDRLANKVVCMGNDANGKPIYIPAFPYWLGHARRQVYSSIVFTGNKTNDDAYNMFRGFGVKPKQGECSRILDHIGEVICDGSSEVFFDFTRLQAWQYQNIGQPSRIIGMSVSEEHQVGKGVILDTLMRKIYGRSAFVAAEADQVLGRFNDALLGRVYIFFDEALWSGNHQALNRIKTLSTTNSTPIEKKGISIVTVPVGLNFWGASNERLPAIINEHDERYWILQPSGKRKGDAAYFTALIDEIEHGGAEAYAHYLATLDISGFVPWRDVRRDNAAKRQMIELSFNPHDARVWLKECCLTNVLLGMKFVTKTPDNELWNYSPEKLDAPPDWVESNEYSFGELSAAYVVWQATVRSPIRPQPTHIASLGEILRKAGFEWRHTNKGQCYKLPSTEACLEALMKLPRDEQK